MSRWVVVLSNLLTAVTVLALGSIAIGAAPTLVTIIQGGQALSNSNLLPVNVVSGGGSAAITCNASSSAPSYSAGQNPCSQDLSGNIRVAVPSSQLITTGTAGSPSTQVLSVQGVSSGTKLIITGAGTAGTADAGVQSIQGIASMTPVTTNLAATTTGGAPTTNVITATASDNHSNLKNGAGTVYFIAVLNNSATINYWRLYDAGTGFNGCNSATNIKAWGIIPGNSTNGGGWIQSFGATGLAFATGISICITSGFGQTDTTNATATAIGATVGYD